MRKVEGCYEENGGHEGSSALLATLCYWFIKDIQDYGVDMVGEGEKTVF